MEMNGTTIIRRPIEAVYVYVMDVANDADWRTGLDESGWRSDESISVGAVGYSRAGDQEIEWRIETYVPGKQVDWKLLNGPFSGYGGYRFEEVEGGTRFTLVADIRPVGLYRLLGPLFRRMGKRQNQADVEKLRDILESAETSSRQTMG
jgi:uncharacterized membrane protein